MRVIPCFALTLYLCTVLPVAGAQTSGEPPSASAVPPTFFQLVGTPLAGTVGVAYSFRYQPLPSGVSSIGSCIPDWTISVTAGALPPGLSAGLLKISSGRWAVVIGTPTTPGTYTARITATDSKCGYQGNGPFNVEILAASTDQDGDGIADDVDNCTLVANPGQYDADGDGYGNACDADLNNDGVTNAQDFAIFRNRLGTSDGAADLNGNGTVNAQDFAMFRAMLGSPPGPSGLHP